MAKSIQYEKEIRAPPPPPKNRSEKTRYPEHKTHKDAKVLSELNLWKKGLTTQLYFRKSLIFPNTLSILSQSKLYLYK